MTELPLLTALRALAPDLSRLQCPWWIIGSSAMRMHGVEAIVPQDIDLLVSEVDARTLLDLWGMSPMPATPSHTFRSRIFARRTDLALPLDLMSGFEVRSSGRWHTVDPASRLQLPFAAADFYVPDLGELVRLCDLFGRKKDAERKQQLLQFMRLPPDLR